MIQAQQHSYLKALGIPVWVRRTRVGNAVSQTTKATPHDKSKDKPIKQTVLEDALRSSTDQIAKKSNPSSTRQGLDIPFTQSDHPAVDYSTLDHASLKQQVDNCKLCTLHQSCNQPLFTTGESSADYLLISDAPSSDEDRQANALAGKAGTLLTNMLRAIDLSPQQTYITHTVKCRTPNDRTPHADEQASCQGYLNHQITLVKPKAILILGRTAAQHVLQLKSPLAALRTQPHCYPGSNIPVFVTYHPRYLLRKPADKRKAWEDLKRFRQHAIKSEL